MNPDEQIKIAEDTIRLLQDYVEIKKTSKRLKTASVNNEVDDVASNILDGVIENIENL